MPRTVKKERARKEQGKAIKQGLEEKETCVKGCGEAESELRLGRDNEALRQ